MNQSYTERYMAVIFESIEKQFLVKKKKIKPTYLGPLGNGKHFKN